MVRSTAHIITILLLGFSGCTSPTTRLKEQNTPLPIITANANRLRVLTPFKAPAQISEMGLTGNVECLLRVESDGHVSKAERTTGSTRVWDCLSSQILRLRFASTRQPDFGPWEVVLGVSANQSQGVEITTTRTVIHSGSEFAAIQSKFPEMQSSILPQPIALVIYIADVKAIDKSTK